MILGIVAFTAPGVIPEAEQDRALPAGDRGKARDTDSTGRVSGTIDLHRLSGGSRDFWIAISPAEEVDDMDDSKGKAFARQGGEKMIYDVRMGPQAVRHNDKITVVYQSGTPGPAAHPHIISYDLGLKRWGEPSRVGHAPYYDHHFAPVLWFDKADRAHVLYRCHGFDGGIHLVSSRADSFDDWTETAAVAPSITYPRIILLDGGTLMLYYRGLGHMGYWAYRLSHDGGNTWSRAVPVVDLDQNPETNNDTWTGSYHSVCVSQDGRSVHVAFVYLDEQKRWNPLYNRRFRSKTTINRHHLYYFRLDAANGRITDADGNTLKAPLTRAEAEKCKIWDTGYRLTNMPSILVDRRDEPCFLLPVSGKSPWQCTFYFVGRTGKGWKRIPLAETNNIWCGALLQHRKDDALAAEIVVGTDYGELADYGGGEIEEWVSSDGGDTWSRARMIVPDPRLLYNNPKAVDISGGGTMDGTFVFFGWKGPASLHRAAGKIPPGDNGGQAFLWSDGKYL